MLIEKIYYLKIIYTPTWSYYTYSEIPKKSKQTVVPVCKSIKLF